MLFYFLLIFLSNIFTVKYSKTKLLNARVNKAVLAKEKIMKMHKILGIV